jgi:hypothetical protein
MGIAQDASVSTLLVSLCGCDGICYESSGFVYVWVSSLSEWNTSLSYPPYITSCFMAYRPPANLQSLQLLRFSLKDGLSTAGVGKMFIDGPESKYFRFRGPRRRGEIRVRPVYTITKWQIITTSRKMPDSAIPFHRT